MTDDVWVGTERALQSMRPDDSLSLRFVNKTTIVMNYYKCHARIIPLKEHKKRHLNSSFPTKC